MEPTARKRFTTPASPETTDPRRLKDPAVPETKLNFSWRKKSENYRDYGTVYANLRLQVQNQLSQYYPEEEIKLVMYCL